MESCTPEESVSCSARCQKLHALKGCVTDGKDGVIERHDVQFPGYSRFF